MANTRRHQNTRREAPPENPNPENVVVEDAGSHADSSHTGPVAHVPANTPPATREDPETSQRFIQNALQSLLARMENLEKRYELQRQEDIQRLIAQLEERSNRRREEERRQNTDHLEGHAEIDQPHAATRRQRPDTSIRTSGVGSRDPVEQSEQGRASRSHYEALRLSSAMTPVQVLEERPMGEITRHPDQGDGTYRRKYRRGHQNNSPFVDQIVDAQFLEDFDCSFLSKYDGSQDPQMAAIIIFLDALDISWYMDEVRNCYVVTMQPVLRAHIYFGTHFPISVFSEEFNPYDPFLQFAPVYPNPTTDPIIVLSEEDSTGDYV